MDQTPYLTVWGLLLWIRLEKDYSMITNKEYMIKPLDLDKVGIQKTRQDWKKKRIKNWTEKAPDQMKTVSNCTVTRCLKWSSESL